MSSLNHDFVIRPLSSADLPTIRQLHTNHLAVPYSSAFYRQLLIHQHRQCLVAHPPSHPDLPIALVSASISTPPPPLGLSPLEPRVHILTLCVLPQYRRHGIARRLVRDVLDALSPSGTLVSATVALSNENGHKFFSSIGFRSQGVITDAYRLYSLPQQERDAVLFSGRLKDVAV